MGRVVGAGAGTLLESMGPIGSTRLEQSEAFEKFACHQRNPAHIASRFGHQIGRGGSGCPDIVLTMAGGRRGGVG